MGGQCLAPRSQWGEETGETAAEILAATLHSEQGEIRDTGIRLTKNSWELIAEALEWMADERLYVVGSLAQNQTEYARIARYINTKLGKD